MDDGDSYPVLESLRHHEPVFNYLDRIPITSDIFSLGRGIKNSVILPSSVSLSIGSYHCQFRKGKNNEWTLEDNSLFGIKINGATVGKGLEQKLCDGDIITLECTHALVYKFLNSPLKEEVPRKILKNGRKRNGIKEQLQTEMNRKIKNELAAQIENLNGEKNEVECQKTIPLQESSAIQLLATMKMNRKIFELKMSVREETEKRRSEAQNSAEKWKGSLPPLAAEMIQKQGEQSVAISTLQEQLGKLKIQLQTVESERNTILNDICAPENCGSSKEMVLNEMGELMESELQCSICNEVFVEPTTLNCSHTFCKYCISVWKKNKKDCPICRASITSECKSLALNSFIEKMVQSLSEELKQKRKDILEERKDERWFFEESDHTR